ncbi:trypsin-like serine protease [Halovulum dunhuangense]|uniref:Trypsin-like serine protease n=1 Tax=Halovulum dunhuangense TaxID=1505036 RepID=A0A849KU90_9RHOB|nr:trypsin-like peptidase domain-containing protein [Halovulum dunhuangense]NNU78828.1 trypsin-like serine protease [Halovulum dunhuangense]
MRWLIGTFLALATLGLPAGASDPSAPRLLVDATEARAWAGVGRLDLADAGFCTATLITDRHVLTAAHCLFSRRTGELYAPERIVFQAGLRNGRAAATRSGRRFILHDEYRYDDEDKLKRVATDLAIVELDLPIRNATIVPFQPHRYPRSGDRVTMVSYAAGREDAPALQEECNMLDIRGDVLVYSCDVTFGASGSPAFIMSEDGPRIASIVSAMAQWREKEVSLAASLGSPLETLLARLEETDPVFRSTIASEDGSRPSIALQLGRDASNGLPQIDR